MGNSACQLQQTCESQLQNGLLSWLDFASSCKVLDSQTKNRKGSLFSLPKGSWSSDCLTWAN